jgi:hypothetical protein
MKLVRMCGHLHAFTDDNRVVRWPNGLPAIVTNDDAGRRFLAKNLKG